MRHLERFTAMGPLRFIVVDTQSAYSNLKLWKPICGSNYRPLVQGNTSGNKIEEKRETNHVRALQALDGTIRGTRLHNCRQCNKFVTKFLENISNVLCLKHIETTACLP